MQTRETKKAAGICPADVAEFITDVVARAHGVDAKGRKHANKFSFGLAELRAKYPDKINDGKLPVPFIAKLKEALASFTDKAIAGYHAGALYIARQSETGRLFKRGVSGDNGAEIAAVRTTATVHTRNEHEQSILAASKLTALRVHMTRLADRYADATTKDERAELVAAARKLTSTAEDWRKFCPKERKVRATAGTALREAIDAALAKEKAAVKAARAKERADKRAKAAKAASKRTKATAKATK